MRTLVPARAPAIRGVSFLPPRTTMRPFVGLQPVLLLLMTTLLAAGPFSLAAQEAPPAAQRPHELSLQLGRAYPSQRHEICREALWSAGLEYRLGREALLLSGLQAKGVTPGIICDRFPCLGRENTGTCTESLTEQIPMNLQIRVGPGHRLSLDALAIHLAAVAGLTRQSGRAPRWWVGTVGGLGMRGSGAGIEFGYGWDRVRRVKVQYRQPADAPEWYWQVESRTHEHQRAPMAQLTGRLYLNW